MYPRVSFPARYDSSFQLLIQSVWACLCACVCLYVRVRIWVSLCVFSCSGMYCMCLMHVHLLYLYNSTGSTCTTVHGCLKVLVCDVVRLGVREKNLPLFWVWTAAGSHVQRSSLPPSFPKLCEVLLEVIVHMKSGLYALGVIVIVIFTCGHVLLHMMAKYASVHGSNVLTCICPCSEDMMCLHCSAKVQPTLTTTH